MWIPYYIIRFLNYQRAKTSGRERREAWSAGDTRELSRGRLPGRVTRCSRKEVIQPQVPLRLPCYDFAPVTELTFGGCLLAVSTATSGALDSVDLTGGVYKARERIHRSLLICDY